MLDVGSGGDVGKAASDQASSVAEAGTDTWEVLSSIGLYWEALSLRHEQLISTLPAYVGTVSPFSVLETSGTMEGVIDEPGFSGDVGEADSSKEPSEDWEEDDEGGG